MTPLQARLKAAVRKGIDLCTSVDAAGATASRSKSTAGEWNNLNLAIFPPADCALTLDGVAVSMGERPPITSAMARELGGVFLPIAVDPVDAEDMHTMLAEHCRRGGELQAELAASLSDRAIGACEARDALVPAEAQLAVLVQTIEALRAISEGRGA